MHLNLLSVGIATVGSVWQNAPSFFPPLMSNSDASHELNLTNRLPLDKKVFAVHVAQIICADLVCGVVLSLWH